MVEWYNLTRELSFSQVSTNEDVVSWHLEASGDFTAKSLYLQLSQGAVVTHFREVWRMWVPQRIKPSDGLCSLCGEPEDCDHIFFKCSLARFIWAGVRELLHYVWNQAGAGDFLAISHGLTGRVP
jgi:hypothetical protein